MWDVALTEEQKEIRDLARKIAKEQIEPVRAELDEKEEFPWAIMKVLAEAGLFGVYIPEEYGGFGKGIYELCLVTEELSKVCGGVAVSYAACGLGSYPFILMGSEEQKKKYLPQIASGEEAGRVLHHRKRRRFRRRGHPHRRPQGRRIITISPAPSSGSPTGRWPMSTPSSP